MQAGAKVGRPRGHASLTVEPADGTGWNHVPRGCNVHDNAEKRVLQTGGDANDIHPMFSAGVGRGVNYGDYRLVCNRKPGGSRRSGCDCPLLEQNVDSKYEL